MLSEVTLNLLDPGLGAVPANAGKTQLVFGVSNKGTPNTLYSAGGITPARNALRSGPLLDAAAQVLGVAGGTVLMMPLTPSTYGTVTSSFALTGSGTGTVTGSRGPEQVVKVKIIAGGTPGPSGMTYQVAIGSGAYGSTIASAADPYSAQVIGQYFTKLVFGNVTYVANDVYTVGLDGAVVRTGSGPSTALDGTINSPVDAYDIRVLVTKTGGLGAGTFKYSLDGGNGYSGDIGIPSAPGKYVIPGTGVVLTFAGTFTEADVYAGASTAASWGNSDATAALDAAMALPNAWGFCHFVGTPSSATNAASLAAAVSAKMTTAETNFRYAFAIIECPSTEADSAIAAAFATFVDKNVHVAVGDTQLTSFITGQKDRRNLAWAYAARLSNTKLSSHPGQIEPSNGGGALVNVRSIYRDEFATPALDAARFVTARTYIGLPGYFITDGQTMATPGSDYSSVMNLRVINRMREVTRFKAMLFLNKALKLGTNGFIDEVVARKIEANVKQGLQDTVVAEDEVSSVEVVCSRTDNILSTSTLNIEVSGIPKGYPRRITVTIGLKNPVLAAA